MLILRWYLQFSFEKTKSSILLLRLSSLNSFISRHSRLMFPDFAWRDDMNKASPHPSWSKTWCWWRQSDMNSFFYTCKVLMNEYLREVQNCREIYISVSRWWTRWKVCKTEWKVLRMRFQGGGESRYINSHHSTAISWSDRKLFTLQWATTGLVPKIWKFDSGEQHSVTTNTQNQTTATHTTCVTHATYTQN